MRARLVEPSTEQILAYCADDPVERVFLEDVARRESGRFAALENGEGGSHALCHLGTNVVPSGSGCSAFAEVAARVAPRMLIGEQAAVTELWDAARRRLPRLGRTGSVSPSTSRTTPPEPGDSGPPRGDAGGPRLPRARVCPGALRGARRRPAAARPERLPLADAGPDRGRALVALARGRRDPVQGRGVRVDARGGSAPAGLGRPAGAPPRLCGAGAPRPDPPPARESADGLPVRAGGERAGDRAVRRGGNESVLDYRSLLF